MKRRALVDADTILYEAACVIQENKYIATHNISHRRLSFKNKTAFKEWLASDKGRGYVEDDFTFSTESSLKEDVEKAFYIVREKVNMIASRVWFDDIRLFIGGTSDSNYRKQLATIKPYKGHRPEKPIALEQIRNYAKETYKSILIVSEGQEAEDDVSIQGYAAYLKARKAKDREQCYAVMCHVDKDLIQVPGLHWNYNKPTEEPVWIDSLQAAKNFWYQMLVGDPTDSIAGLEGIHPTIKEKYSLRTTKGCGEQSALKILEGCTTEKQMAANTMEAYKAFYGDKWKSYFNENALLVRMRRECLEMFNAVDYCKGLGVE